MFHRPEKCDSDFTDTLSGFNAGWCVCMCVCIYVYVRTRVTQVGLRKYDICVSREMKGGER